MNTRMPLARRDRLLSPLIGLLLVTLAGTPVHGATVSDFDDGVPDWNELQNRGATFTESEGRLVASGNISAMTDCITWNLGHVSWGKPLLVQEGERLIVGVDIIEASRNDVQVLLELPVTGTGGYSLTKDQDEIGLSKWSPMKT